MTHTNPPLAGIPNGGAKKMKEREPPELAKSGARHTKYVKRRVCMSRENGRLDAHTGGASFTHRRREKLSSGVVQERHQQKGSCGRERLLVHKTLG